MTTMWMRVAMMVLACCSLLAAQRPPAFAPPRLVRTSLPPAPLPTVLGGGEVLIEAIIDRSGTVTRPVLLRSTPPYSQLMLDAVMRWQFLPARAQNPAGGDAPVEASVMIAAVYRPPTMYNGPTLGDGPRDVATASGEAALPTLLVQPAYPPLAHNVEYTSVVFEVLVDESGAIREVKPVATDPAFEGVAREALKQWRFRPGSVRGRPSPATVCVLFGFRPPVVSSVR